MIYLDSGILIRALLREHPQHRECVAALDRDCASSCHSLAECFNTLTGFFKVANDDASELIQSLPDQMPFAAMTQSDYLTVIKDARRRGVQGGLIYDALHAQIARRLKAERIVTYNLSNFRHVAPDLLVTEPASL